MPPPTADAPPCSPRIREVGWARPITWLARGMADFLRCPLPGLLHGLAAMLFGLASVALARDHFWILAGACSGYLIVAPLAATGLYEVSRKLARHESAGAADIVAVWRSLDGRLVRFGLLLALAGTGWVLTSAALITGFAPVPIKGPMDFVRHVVLAEGSWLFEAWLLLGALLAAPMFASSVVALPMLLDRPVGVMTAVLTSWRTVLGSPIALAHWAFIIALLTAVGMGAAMLGLLLVVPWLAHASWHAYRDLVAHDDSAEPES